MGLPGGFPGTNLCPPGSTRGLSSNATPHQLTGRILPAPRIGLAYPQAISFTRALHQQGNPLGVSAGPGSLARHQFPRGPSPARSRRSGPPPSLPARLTSGTSLDSPCPWWPALRDRQPSPTRAFASSPQRGLDFCAMPPPLETSAPTQHLTPTPGSSNVDRLT